MSKKKDMWKLAELGKTMHEWAPVKKQPIKKQAAPAAPAAPQMAAQQQVGVAVVGSKKQKPKSNKIMISPTKQMPTPTAKAEIGTPKETDWSKPDGAPVDMLNAVQRASRTKSMEDQGQKKEIAVFSEAQKKHKKDGGFPTAKSEFFGDWQPNRIGYVEPLKKSKK